MSNSLGDRIKALRKELKMTQTELAGSEMTKSMLSQIENGFATPSMKNLQYLASRLGKPMSYFLEDAEYQSSLPLEEIHEDLKAASSLIRSFKREEALSRLESMLQKYSFDRDSKLYADFLIKYGECLIDLKRPLEGEEKIKEAVNIYKNKLMFVDAAKAHLELIGIAWNNFDYKMALDILEQGLEIYNNSISKDYAFEIETLYWRSVMCLGNDNLEEGIDAINKALAISKQTNIYYKSDELYKNLAMLNGFLGNFEHFDEYIDKGRLYATFTENNNILASIEGVCGVYNNQIDNPQKALEYLDKALSFAKGPTATFLYVEKAKSFYLLKEYLKALDIIKLIEYPTYTPFKYDYLHIWSAKVYEGLCLANLGGKEKALEAIRQGIDKMQIVGESKGLAHAYKALSDVYSEMSNFESAFAALKKANEIEEIVKTSKIFY